MQSRLESRLRPLRQQLTAATMVPLLLPNLRQFLDAAAQKLLAAHPA